MTTCMGVVMRASRSGQLACDVTTVLVRYIELDADKVDVEVECALK